MRAAFLVLVALIVVSLLPPAAQGEEVRLYRPGDVYGSVYLPGIMLDMAWGPGGDRIAVALGVAHELRLYDSEGTLLWALDTGEGPGPLDWSPDGLLIAVGVGDALWVVASNTRALVFKKQYDYLVTDVAWSPDGSMLAVATAGGTVYVYDSSGALRYALPSFTGPVTALAWSPDGQRLLVGDGSYRVHSVSVSRPLSDVVSVKVDGVVKGFAFRPGYGGELVVATNASIYKAYLYDNGTLTLLKRVSYGSLSAPSWSPDASTIAVPHGRELGFFDPDLNPITYVSQPAEYSFYFASWNPKAYSILAAGGRNIATSASGYYLIYTGSYYVLQATPPVTAFCYSGTCSSRLELDAWNQTITVGMKVVLDKFGDGQDNVTVDLSLHGQAMRTYTITGAEALEGRVGELTVPGDQSLIIILRSSEASAILEYVNGSRHELQGLGVIAPPGEYTVTLNLPQPSDWLGPGWVLEKRVEITVGPGQGVVFNYTGFTLEALTARLELDVEPGTLVSLRFPNDTVQTVVEKPRASYTVPVGSYVVELALPAGENVLVEDRNVLVKSTPVRLDPGDLATLAFRYGDVLGWIDLNLPPASLVAITPPWQRAPAWAKEYPEGGRDQLLAQPGIYLVEASISKPAGWIGPEPPVYKANVTVERGRRVEVNLYHDPKVAEWLNLLSRSGRLTIISPEGYKIIVLSDSNKTVELDSGNKTLLAPPGNYTLQLIDAAKNLILAESKLQVEGPGNYTVKLEPPKEQSEQQQPPQVPPGETGSSKRRIIAVIVAAVIPIAAAAGAILYLRRRSRGREQTLGEITW